MTKAPSHKVEKSTLSPSATTFMQYGERPRRYMMMSLMMSTMDDTIDRVCWGGGGEGNASLHMGGCTYACIIQGKLKKRQTMKYGVKKREGG